MSRFAKLGQQVIGAISRLAKLAPAGLTSGSRADSRSKLNQLTERWTILSVGLLLTLISCLALGWSLQEDSGHPRRSWLRQLEDWAYVYRKEFRAPTDDRHKIRIVAIDDESVRDQGRWPWPRAMVAELIERIAFYNPKIIALDMTFSEEEHNPVERLKSVVGPERLKLTSEEIQRLDGDEQLRRVIEKHKEKIVLGNTFLGAQNEPAYKIPCFVAATSADPAAALMMADLDHLSVQLWQSIEYRVYFDRYFQDIFRDQGRSESIDRRRRTWAEYCRRFLRAPDAESVELGLADPYYENVWLKDWSVLVGREKTPEHQLLQSLPARDSIEKFKELSGELLYPVYSELVPNVTRIAEVARHHAMFNLELDQDGQCRRYPLFFLIGDQGVLPLASKVFSLLRDRQWRVEFQQRQDRVRGIGQVKVARADEGLERGEPMDTDVQGSLRLNWRGSRYSFPHLQASDLLRERKSVTVHRVGSTDAVGEDQRELLEDAIVILGVTAIGNYDLRPTPFLKDFPGVEIHAHALDNLLSGDGLRSLKSESWILLSASLLIGLLLTWTAWKSGGFVLLGVSTFLVGALWVIDVAWLFRHMHAETTLLPVMLQIGLSAFALLLFKTAIESARTKTIRATFSRYVAPSVVELLTSEGRQVELGGEKRELTAFFSDIRQFTSLSEHLDPARLVEMLNSYFEPMTEVIFTNGGTLDKFLGDGIMAFFGAPGRQEDHAVRAARCALESLSRLRGVNEKFEMEGLPSLEIGIGLHSGDMAVGNVGSERLRNYTIMGDGVNTAARIQDLTKEFGARILISQGTYAQLMRLDPRFRVRRIEHVTLRGKQDAVQVYELLDHPEYGDRHPFTDEDLQLFERALQASEKGATEDARRLLTEFSKRHPQDGPCRRLLGEKLSAPI